MGRPWQAWVGLVARQVLGWVLLVAGVLKITNIYGTGVNIRAYQLPLPFELTNVLAWAMPLFEIIVGLMLVAGAFTRVAAGLGTLSMIAFIIAIASVWARGISIDCGCFGTGGVKPTFEPWLYFWEIVRDVALALCGAWLLWRPRTPFSVDAWVAGPSHPLTDDTDPQEQM